MNEIINEKVGVLTIFDAKNGITLPKKVKWRNRIYLIEKIGYHHKVRDGRKLLHIFSVANTSIALKLCLDTENLHWILEEVSDGLTS